MPRLALLCLAWLLASTVVFALDAAEQAKIDALADAAAIAAFEASIPNRYQNELDRGTGYRLLSARWESLGDIEKARASLDRSVVALEQVPASVELVYSLGERSYMHYLQTGKREDFCPDRARALQLARDLADAEALVYSLVRHAFCHDDDDSYQLGLAELDEAMLIARDANLDKSAHSMVANASGLLYRRLQLHDRAYAAFAQAYQLWLEDGDVPDYFNMLHTMVGSAIELGRWEVADDHVNRMFEVAAEHPGSNDYEFFAWFNRGRLGLARGAHLEAQAAFDNALALQETTPETQFIARSYLLRAETRVWLADFSGVRDDLAVLQQDYPHANPHFDLLQRLTAAIEADDVDNVLAVMLELRQREARQRYDFMDANARVLTREHEERVANYEASLLKQQLALRELALEQAEGRASLALQSTINLALLSALLLGLIIWLAHSLRLNRQRAHTDFLTGIANRGRVFEEGFRLTDQASRRDASLSVVLIDIDHFKAVNDRFGHGVGDRAILATVEALKELLHKGELLGRVGGEEFILLLPGVGIDGAGARAEAMRQAVAAAGFTHADKLPVNFTCSLGVASREQGDNFQAIVNRADQALYAAKGAGRDKVVCLAAADEDATEVQRTVGSRRAPRPSES